GYYDTEQAALRDVVDAIERHGKQSVDTLALGYDDPNGPGHAIAKGKALAKLARQQFQSVVTNSHVDGRSVRSGSTPYTTREATASGDSKARRAITGKVVKK